MPLTSVEIARRVGLNQSWVSRVLKTLKNAGYVRKPTFHSFAADYGLLTLSGISSRQFPFAQKPLPGLTEFIHGCPDCEVALGCLWQGQILYFLRIHFRLGYTPPVAGYFSLHESSIALRILLECSEPEALLQLQASLARYGEKGEAHSAKWYLSAARKRLGSKSGMLVSTNPDSCGASCLLSVPQEPLAAIALSGPSSRYSSEQIMDLLSEAHQIAQTKMTSSGE